MTITHRMTDTPTYKTWLKMRERCGNPLAAQFRWYGGRGITVCERWQVFENFLSDMGERPEGASIDRIDGERGYEPGNCRWVDKTAQMRNQSTTIIVEWKGERISLRDLADRYSVPFTRVYKRWRAGHSVESAVLSTRKLITDEQRVAIAARDGMTTAAVARELGMSESSVRRVRQGAVL